MTVLLLLAALPERVTLKTPTESFTATHDVALRDGHLWWRKHGETAWAMLPPDGLPASKSRKAFHRPEKVESISADGDNLIAIGPGGAVYYAKLSTLDWTDVWGPTGMTAPLSVKGLDAFAMSHRFIAYEDIDGNSHPVSAGVTTFYGLRDGGRTLAYADPWLPPNFERTLCLPERGRFIASALSASASTVFVMDSAGRGFTRLVDFDIHGENPALGYTYGRERRKGVKAGIRTLPAPDWVAQPPIPGKHTTRITILQTGWTNSDRELRVEGEGGVWTKRVDEQEWKLVPESFTPSGPWVSGEPPLSPIRDEVLLASNPWANTRISLEDWNPACEPARLRIEAGAEVLDLALPFHPVVLPAHHYKGAVLLPAGNTPWLKKLRLVAAGSTHLDVDLEVTKDEVHVLRLPVIDLRFRK
jgi:hypothetical protein